MAVRDAEQLLQVPPPVSIAATRGKAQHSAQTVTTLANLRHVRYDKSHTSFVMTSIHSHTHGDYKHKLPAAIHCRSMH